MRAAKNIIHLAKQGETLKRVNRTGWSLAGVNHVRPESVGEHSYGAALLSLLISKELIENDVHVDLSKVTSMALIHDLPEALTSDIPQIAAQLGGNDLSEGKRKAEREAMSQITKNKPNFEKWLTDMWDDAERKTSLESRIVACADMLDMLIHAVTLEASGVSPEILDQFFTSSQDRLDQLDIPVVTDIFWELYQEHLENAEKMGIHLAKLTKIL
jgi:putative hydrolase of HD superfamily